MSNDNKRLIEDYLPIEAISAEASREKSVRKGHISTLHLWWARRPLVACRAAVYGALVPASRFVPENGTDEKRKSLGRANSARFVKSLCRYPSDSKPEEKAAIARAIQEAQRHILIAHADRLTVELAEESEFKDAFPDCELGAMPPFGHLYGMPVYVDSRLALQEEIAFNAGTHTEALRMPYAEFERLAEPELLWLAHMM